MRIRILLVIFASLFVIDSWAQALPRVEILGQSQTQAWFNVLDLPVYQGRFILGTGFYQWAEPDNEIWSEDVLETVGNVPPYLPEDIEVVIATIGTPPPFGNYFESISDLTRQIKSFYPNIERILLMPLVSGPNGSLCMVNGQIVKSTMNRATIERVATQISLRDSKVELGPVLEVFDCSEFRDVMGHVLFTSSQNFAVQMTNYFFSLGLLR